VIFKGIADLLEIEGANPFRIRAYRTAARVEGEYSRELRALLAQGADLPKLPASARICQARSARSSRPAIVRCASACAERYPPA
jgi:hypothetical protein